MSRRGRKACGQVAAGPPGSPRGHTLKRLGRNYFLKNMKVLNFSQIFTTTTFPLEKERVGKKETLFSREKGKDCLIQEASRSTT